MAPTIKVVKGNKYLALYERSDERLCFETLTVGFSRTSGFGEQRRRPQLLLYN